MFGCSICGKGILTESLRRFFCRDCYKECESDIMARSERVKFSTNYEHRQRRQVLRDRKLTYLGNGFDVDDFDCGYRLAPE